MKRILLASAAIFAFTGVAQAADCPAVTVKDMMGVSAGKYPQQYELSEFQAAAKCKLSFKANPGMAALNGQNQRQPETARGRGSRSR